MRNKVNTYKNKKGKGNEMVTKTIKTTDEAVETIKATEEVVKEVKPTKEIQLAYVGPSFKGVSHCTVFIGKLPDELTNAQKDCSAFKRLVVEICDYGKAQDELKKNDSIIFSSYKTAWDYLNTKEGSK